MRVGAWRSGMLLAHKCAATALGDAPPHQPLLADLRSGHCLGPREALDMRAARLMRESSPDGHRLDTIWATQCAPNIRRELAKRARNSRVVLAHRLSDNAAINDLLAPHGQAKRGTRRVVVGRSCG